jgi:outer membrane lipoprotein carrier protein
MKIKPLFFFIFISIFAAATPAQGQDNVKKAKDILNKLSKNYKGYKSIKAGFTITSENVDKTKVSQAGTIWIKHKAFKIEMSDQDIVCDGSTIWTAQKEVLEVTIKDYKPTDNEIQPAEIFSLWEKGFDYVWTEKVTEGGKSLDVIDLVPSTGKESKDYSKVKLKVDAASNTIVSCTIIKKSGVKISYTLTSQAKNPKLDKNFFEMDTEAKKKAGYAIVDLRRKKR